MREVGGEKVRDGRNGRMDFRKGRGDEGRNKGDRG